MGAGEAGEEVAERVLDGLGERLGHADGQGRAEGVAEPARVLDGRPVVPPGDTDADGAAGFGEGGRPLRVRAALRQLGLRERPEEPQQVRDAFGVLGAAVLGAPLQLVLQLGEDVGVEQFAQLRLAEQLGQETGVEGEGGGAPLGQRGVALVEELGDVAEEQRAREGGRLGRGDLDEPDAAGLDVPHQLGQPGDVEDVLEAFADRFQDDRERPELARHLKELSRALPLLPQGGALAR